MMDQTSLAYLFLPPGSAQQLKLMDRLHWPHMHIQSKLNGLPPCPLSCSPLSHWLQSDTKWQAALWYCLWIFLESCFSSSSYLILVTMHISDMSQNASLNAGTRGFKEHAPDRLFHCSPGEGESVCADAASSPVTSPVSSLHLRTRHLSSPRGEGQNRKPSSPP